MEGAPIIVAHGVRKEFGTASGTGRDTRLLALGPFDLAVRQGELVGIVGPSGCGKSTLLNLVAGLDRPTNGQILVQGRSVTGPHEIGYVFQSEALLPWRTAIRNAEFALELKGMPPRERRPVARAQLQKLGLGAFEEHFPHQLSGGMRKRLQLAAVLAANPAVLLMDEPFAALDAQTRTVVEDDFLRVWHETGKTVVFVTHDLQEAIAMCTRVIIMTARPGRMKAEYGIDLPQSASTVERRLHGKFQGIFSQIWADLRAEVGTQL